MKAWGVTEEQIREAAASVGLRIAEDYARSGVRPDGRALRFRLALDTSQARDAYGMLPYQRVSTWREAPNGNPRRIAAVCWHGHRDMLRALFAIAPDARVQTALADYRGADHFEETYRDTAGTGNDYHVSPSQACGCTSTAWSALYGETVPALAVPRGC